MLLLGLFPHIFCTKEFLPAATVLWRIAISWDMGHCGFTIYYDKYVSNLGILLQVIFNAPNSSLCIIYFSQNDD